MQKNQNINSLLKAKAKFDFGLDAVNLTNDLHRDGCVLRLNIVMS